jgi:hypothetical protein
MLRRLIAACICVIVNLKASCSVDFLPWNMKVCKVLTEHFTVRKSFKPQVYLHSLLT